MQPGQQRNPLTPIVLGALLLVQILFGINYVVSKVVVAAFHPLIWASIRLWVATFLMFAFAVGLRRPHPQYNRAFFKNLVIFSLLGVVINQGSFLYGLKLTTANNSAVLNTLIPVFTLVIVTLRGQEKLTLSRSLGFIFALAGVLTLKRFEDLQLSNETWRGDLLTVLNCLSFACFLSWGKKFMESQDRVWTTAWLFAFGSVGMTLLSLPFWGEFVPPTIHPELLGAILYSIIGGTLLTYFLSNWALARAQSSAVALFVYIQPVVAVGFSWLWLNQSPSLRTVIASSLIFFGMILGLPKKQNPL